MHSAHQRAEVDKTGAPHVPDDEEKDTPATDTPETPPKPKFRWIKDWWRSPWAAVSLAAVVILIVVSAAVVLVKTRAPMQLPPASAVELVGPANVTGIAQYNGQFAFSTPAHAINGGKDLTDAELNEVITFGVHDVKTLQLWQLCGAELRAAATAHDGLAAAYRKFPRNLPYDEPTPNVLQAVGAGNEQAMAAVLAAAATYADSVQIPCIDGTPSMTPHWVAFRLNGVAVVVSDYDVTALFLPLEAQIFLHKCASRVQADRDSLANAPVDTKVASNHPSFTEVTKASGLTTDDAVIALLRQDERTNC